MKVVMKKFKITRNRFYFIKHKIQHHNKNINDVLMELEMNKYKIEFHGWDQKQPLPQVLLVASPGMQSQYQWYGDCIRFDITYSLCKVRAYDGKGKWNLGVFSGFREDLAPCVLGLVFIRDETTEHFAIMMKLFIKMMGSAPKTIITDQQTTLIAGIRQYKKQQKSQLNHLMDQFHILHSIGRKIPKELKKTYLPIFRKIVFSKNMVEIKEGLNAIEEIKNSDFQKYIHQWFNPHYKSFCQYFCPQVFHGLSITTGPAQKLNDLIKTRIRYETTIQNIIAKVEDIDQKLSQRPYKKEDSSIIKIFNDDELDRVRISLQKKVFQHFFEKYAQSFKIKILEEQTNQPLTRQNFYHKKFKVYDEEWGENKGTFYTGISTCKCGDSQKSGLACSHLIAIRRQLKLPYIDLIANRWKLDLGGKKQKLKLKSLVFQFNEKASQ